MNSSIESGSSLPFVSGIHKMNDIAARVAAPPYILKPIYFVLLKMLTQN